MRHDTFTPTPMLAEQRTPGWERAHDYEREGWDALADGDRTTAAAMLDAAARAHADDAGTDVPDQVWLTQSGGTYRAAVCARIARELRGERDRCDRGKPPASALHISPPGWSIDFPPYTSPGGLSYGAGTLSGYGDDWTAHLHELAPDALVIDKRACTSWDDLSRLAVSGPMPGAGVPEGMVDALYGGIHPWRDQPQPDRDHRFGNAHSLDRVALDVYCRIAHRFGARVMTVAYVLRERPDISTTSEARDRMAVA